MVKEAGTTIAPPLRAVAIIPCLVDIQGRNINADVREPEVTKALGRSYTKARQLSAASDRRWR